MRMTTTTPHRLAGLVRRCPTPLLAASVAMLAACGMPADESSGPFATAVPDTTAVTDATPTVGPVPASTAPPNVDGCGDVAVTATVLANAQFAFVGRVVSSVGEILPWTTDPENPDRPAVPTATRWVTFEVERWYLNDWGRTFSVWMPDITVTPDQRIAVGGNAFFTQVGDFAGQSGEVEFCAALGEGEASPDDWSAALGEPFAPSSTVPSTTVVLEPTKVFGERSGPCGPTVLTNGNDDQRVLDVGIACFLEEVDAGRPLVWDLLVPTVEGDPIVTRYDFDGTSVVITTDNSFDNFGSGGVFEERCAGVLPTNWLPDGIDCTARTGIGFIESSLDR